MQANLSLITRAFSPPKVDARVAALEQQVKSLEEQLRVANVRLDYYRDRQKKSSLIHEKSR